jgi:hypothetical protein
MKTDEQFAQDIDQGNEWEKQLWAELSKYIYGLTAPVAAEKVGEKVVGGFLYKPDMAVKTLVAVNQRDREFYGETIASIEAKVRLGSGFDFTGADDFPYPDLIVNEVYKTAPQHMTPGDYLKLSVQEQKTLMRPFHSYWIASTSRQHVAVVIPATKPLWTQKSLYSPKDRRPALNWMCPIRRENGRQAVLFGKFPEDVPRLLTYL